MRLIVLIAAAWLACAAPALAQSALPPALRSAGVTQTQWDAIQREARAEARRANISEAALMAAAEAASVRLAGSGQFNALSLQQAILDTLRERADRIAELQRQLDALTGDADPTAAALFVDARAAIDGGRLDAADALLAQAQARDLAALQQADAEAERRRLRAGETIASRGQIAFVQADYLGAAAHYERAASVVPQTATASRWDYATWRGLALYDHGRIFNAPASLLEAVEAYEFAISLIPRDYAGEEWAEAHASLGNVLNVMGARGSPGALQRAVVAYEAALTVWTRAMHPARWASVQKQLGRHAHSIGRTWRAGRYRARDCRL